MSEALAGAILTGLGAYFAVGAVIALLFLTFGVGAKDKAAKGASIFFRPMIFLGCVGLWPVVLVHWLFGPAINHPHVDEGREA
ncbi:MAG: hypothetical protein AAFV51_10425 [Pseudomonadota bacterium]